MTRPPRQPSAELTAALVRAFNHWQIIPDAHQRKVLRRDFVFHMTDWLNDLDKLHELYLHPQRLSTSDQFDAVFGFLVHAAAHIDAARRILVGDIKPAFQDMYQPAAVGPKGKQRKVV